MTGLRLAATLLAAISLAAQPATPSASGLFKTEKRSLDVRGAYAFWGKSASPGDSGDRVLRVAVANEAIEPAYFDRFYDRAQAIDARLVSEEYKVVYFEFTPAGKYNGLSYYFGPGEGCGYCYDSEVGKEMQLSSGRLKGHLGSKSKSSSFEIDLDVPVPGKEWGKPLAKDGGELGKLYVAYAAAIETQDANAARALLDERMRTHWQKMEKEGKLDRYVAYTWREKHQQMTAPQVTGGFVDGDRAVLFVTGKAPYGAVRGEALLNREGGAWRFSEELLRLE